MEKQTAEDFLESLIAFMKKGHKTQVTRGLLENSLKMMKKHPQGVYFFFIDRRGGVVMPK